MPGHSQRWRETLEIVANGSILQLKGRQEFFWDASCQQKFLDVSFESELRAYPGAVEEQELGARRFRRSDGKVTAVLLDVTGVNAANLMTIAGLQGVERQRLCNAGSDWELGKRRDISDVACGLGLRSLTKKDGVFWFYLLQATTVSLLVAEEEPDAGISVRDLLSLTREEWWRPTP